MENWLSSSADRIAQGILNCQERLISHHWKSWTGRYAQVSCARGNAAAGVRGANTSCSGSIALPPARLRTFDYPGPGRWPPFADPPSDEAISRRNLNTSSRLDLPEAFAPTTNCRARSSTDAADVAPVLRCQLC